MTSSDLARRLAGLPPLSELPPRELEWLAAHGEYRRYEPGDVVVAKGTRVDHLWIVLSGLVFVHRDTPAGRRRVMEWGPGEVTGRLPYSRMSLASVEARLDRTTEALMLHERHFGELVHRCPGFTELTVHMMIDRARSFKASELQAEKLVSLGRLSAGLAHELNNPASAAVRGAGVLRGGLAETERAARELFGSGLPGPSLVALEEVRAACVAGRGDRGVPSPLEQADREAEIEDWLVDRGCDPEQAASLAETPVTLEALDRLADAIPADALQASVRWLAASCATASVASEIEGAARRIHDLVAAVKRFTYMDNLAAPHAVEITGGLKDTVTVLAAKARAKGASIRLDLEPGLPPVRAVGGELNQVWMNLIDNALDAIADSGRIEIVARKELDRVRVSVVDDGPGIPGDVSSRIFDPFFTTKAPGEGTGLGLDIVRRLVQRQGGEIDVRSRPGRTEFSVRLTAAEEGATGSRASSGERAPPDPAADRP